MWNCVSNSYEEETLKSSPILPSETAAAPITEGTAKPPELSYPLEESKSTSTHTLLSTTQNMSSYNVMCIKYIYTRIWHVHMVLPEAMSTSAQTPAGNQGLLYSILF